MSNRRNSMFLSIWHGSSYPNRGKNAHIMHCSTPARESRDRGQFGLGGLRKTTLIWMEAYHHQAMAYYNKRAKQRSLPRYLVLGRMFENMLEPMAEKLQVNQEGPDRVIEAGQGGTHHLEKLNGKRIPRPWNVQNLKGIIHSKLTLNKIFLQLPRGA